MGKTKLPLTITGRTFGVLTPSLIGHTKRGDIGYIIERMARLKERCRTFTLLTNNKDKILRNVPGRGYAVGVLERTDMLNGETTVSVTDYCRTEKQVVELMKEYGNQGKIASYLNLAS
ncbi:hypothetical protein A3K73_04725 [Candidatus Pacearchaeota archaeon RBG_13_36_9]|nr:MAG: hypothetical protein A3K73_04725 [Candidatus Pacearchaeota archaeon RBG_13_36_9]